MPQNSGTHYHWITSQINLRSERTCACKRRTRTKQDSRQVRKKSACRRLPHDCECKAALHACQLHAMDNKVEEHMIRVMRRTPTIFYETMRSPISRKKHVQSVCVVVLCRSKRRKKHEPNIYTFHVGVNHTCARVGCAKRVGHVVALQRTRFR